ncbi:hypothetical protein AB1Y20_020742 [Prymnesium parvum]|uniref:non-specific serine/threonine protein kinase n=1 Tax=Prymnesium parvum TaxID=97485 RepID=A0AB34JVI0_PRYPA
MAVELLDRLSVMESKRPSDERLAGLETVRKLGGGSHGHCYLMRGDDGRLVVHKRVPVSHMLPSDQEVAEREVNILASLSHPFIVRYDRAFVEAGQLCIAMEYASGGDLSHRLDEVRKAGRRVELPQALEWFAQLLLALKYVHRLRVVHRDLALKNIFLSADGVVKLGDFGVARVLGNSELAMTKVGTPCNVSPERCEGKPYSFESDIWALGCLLFEMLTLRPAFQAETMPELVHKIIAGAHAEFRESDGIPPEVEALIDTLLAVDPSKRPTISQLLDSPIVAPHATRFLAADLEASAAAEVQQVEIPLVGYEGASKTKFSERPIFVEGGGRIVDEAAATQHDEKLVAVRQRRLKQMAARRGDSSTGSSRQSSGLSFDKVQNFGSSGLLGYLKGQGADDIISQRG